MQSEFMQKIIKVDISAFKRKGFKRVFKETNNIIKKSKESFSTSMLNKLLDKFVKLKRATFCRWSTVKI